MEANSKWQPVLLILDLGTRLECACGALATIVTGTVAHDEESYLTESHVWCQDCFLAAQEEEDDDDE